MWLIELIIHLTASNQGVEEICTIFIAATPFNTSLIVEVGGSFSSPCLQPLPLVLRKSTKSTITPITSKPLDTTSCFSIDARVMNMAILARSVALSRWYGMVDIACRRHDTSTCIQNEGETNFWEECRRRDEKTLTLLHPCCLFANLTLPILERIAGNVSSVAALLAFVVVLLLRRIWFSAVFSSAKRLARATVGFAAALLLWLLPHFLPFISRYGSRVKWNPNITQLWPPA